MNNSNQEKRNALLSLLQFRFCHKLLYEAGLGLTNSDDRFDSPVPDLVLDLDGAGRLRLVSLEQSGARRRVSSNRPTRRPLCSPRPAIPLRAGRLDHLDESWELWWTYDVR